MKDDAVYLRHILECIRRIEANIAGGMEVDAQEAAHGSYSLRQVLTLACQHVGLSDKGAVV
jgi:hypothetical protein